MNRQALGRMEKLDLREAWQSEAGDFTPWLAREENLALLGDTIGNLQLELVSMEKNVGPFRADIVCVDTANRTKVLVENQLERTDHSHLGQLLTYAAGLEAVCIVWIAERFTEEHRAALDWLNRRTDDSMNFFGLEIELWRIGDSVPAPKFNMVAKPNEWTKGLPGAKGELSETNLLYRDYWTAFREHLVESKSPIRMSKPLPQSWMTFSIGRSCFILTVNLSVQKKTRLVQLVIYEPNRLENFRLLQEQKAEIEQALGPGLEWRELPDAKESHVRRNLDNADPADRDDWPKQHETIRQTLEAFHGAFAARVKTLVARGA